MRGAARVFYQQCADRLSTSREIGSTSRSNCPSNVNPRSSPYAFMTLEQFVFSNCLVRQLAGFKIGQVTHPRIRKRDGRVPLNHSFLGFPLVKFLASLLDVARIERQPDFTATENAIHPKLAFA